MLRSPLGGLQLNNSGVFQTPPLARTGQCKQNPVRVCVSENGRKLLKAVSNNAAAMVQLNGIPRMASHDGEAGVVALQSLGWSHDGRGNATCDPSVGQVSRQLLFEQEQRRLCEQRLVVVQLQVEQASAQIAALTMDRYEPLASREHSISTAVLAAELADSERAFAAALVAQQQQDCDVALATSARQRQVDETELHARDFAAERLAAAQKIAEKWRGRGRRARELAAHLRETLPLTSEWSAEFEKLLKGQVPPDQEHLRVLWECQLRCLRSKSHRCRWHPEVLSWCADVWRRDRGAYEQMAFGGVLLLPHPDTVRKHATSGIAIPGHNVDLYASLGADGATSGWTAAEREFVLKFDEVNVMSGLAWRKVRMHNYSYINNIHTHMKSILRELHSTPYAFLIFISGWR